MKYISRPPFKQACLCLLLLIVFVQPAAQEIKSQSIQANKTQKIEHGVTVTIKLIQVYVTDKNGIPVVDLKKEDFLIYDEGKTQTITEFEQHILSMPTDITEEQLEILYETKLPAPRKLMPRRFFLFFDFAYTNARGIQKAKEAAQYFIDTQLQPSDEVGVLSYSAIKRLTIHEYFTTEHAKARKIVESLGLKEIHGRAEDLEAEYFSKYKNRNPLDEVKAGIKDKLYFDRMESLFQADFFAEQMIDLAKAVRYIPGYKNIILFSSGVPYSMRYGTNIMGSDELRVRTAFQQMLKELAASNSPVYVLSTEEESGKMDVRTRGVFSLLDITTSTGGKYFGNINSYESHLEKIQKLTANYYVLGYYVDEKWDGKYHKIKVDVNRPGCKVYAQEGYFDPKPFTRYTKFEKLLHLVDLALTKNPIFQTPLRFPMTALSCSIEGEPGAALFSKISKEINQEFSGKNTEIVVIIFDEEDNIIKTERKEQDFSKFPKQDIYYYSLFPLSPGEYKCRLVIRNLETGSGAVAAYPVVIFKKPEQGKIELLSPLLLTSERRAFYMKGTVSPRVTDTFTLADYFHFDPIQYAPLVEEELKSDSIVSAVLPYSVSNMFEPEVTIYISLIDQSFGEIIPLDVKILSESKEQELFLLFVEIQIPELSPGDYAMNFAIEEAQSQSSSNLTKIFKIR